MQLLEEFGDSQTDTSLQLQSIDNEQRRVEEEKRVAAIVLPDNNFGEHAIDGPSRPEDTIPEVSTAPKSPMAAQMNLVDITEVTAEATT